MSAFDRIIGYTSIKRELAQISDTIRSTEVYRELGVSAPRGLLLYGEPGVGKSLMAGALIEDSGRRCFVCRKDKPNGDFVKEIKSTFDEAIKNAPSIVYLDDMDKFANGDERHPDAEEYVTVQSCIDEAKDYPVFVLATANNLRCLPRSLRRVGRFDRRLEVCAPRGKDAEDIVRHYLSSKKVESGIDARTISRLLDGRSCAELETVINEAGLYAGFQRAKAITMEHFMAAFMSTLYNVPADPFDDDDCDFTLTGSENTINQIICHEAGHAVVSEILCPGSVTLISVHGDKCRSHGGLTLYYNDDRAAPLYWAQSRIISSLGGMAAVEQRFGIRDAGSSSDLDYAFDRASALIKSNCCCGFAMHTCGFNDSEDLKARQEQAAASEIERYYNKAKEIIALNREFFDALTAALSKKAMLSMEDVRNIRSGCAITPVSI